MTEFVELILLAFTLTALVDRRQVAAGTLVKANNIKKTHLSTYDYKCSSGKICCGYMSFGK